MLRFLAVCAALYATSPAAAQLAPSRSGIPGQLSFGSEQALAELASFGLCYARAQRPNALALIATEPTTRDEVAVYRRLFNTESLSCLIPGTSLRAPIAYVRGAIAEGLYKSGRPFAAEQLLPIPSRAEVRNLSDAARCHAATRRTQVSALTATRPGSPQESEAVSALMEGFEACIPDGVNLRFDSTTLRYRFVEALLRLPSTPVTP